MKSWTHYTCSNIWPPGVLCICGSYTSPTSFSPSISGSHSLILYLYAFTPWFWNSAYKHIKSIWHFLFGICLLLLYIISPRSNNIITNGRISWQVIFIEVHTHTYISPPLISKGYIPIPPSVPETTTVLSTMCNSSSTICIHCVTVVCRTPYWWWRWPLSS